MPVPGVSTCMRFAIFELTNLRCQTSSCDLAPFKTTILYFWEIWVSSKKNEEFLLVLQSIYSTSLQVESYTGLSQKSTMERFTTAVLCWKTLHLRALDTPLVGLNNTSDKGPVIEFLVAWNQNQKFDSMNEIGK